MIVRETRGKSVMQTQPIQNADIGQLWRERASRLALRPLDLDLNEPFVAVLGGSETCARAVNKPYPAQLETMLGMPVANLGVMHAGVTLFSEEDWILELASRASLTVFQVMGAQNMSNPMYSVHPRRNDRFVSASKRLKSLVPDVELAEVHFTGHLLSQLSDCRPDVFRQIVEELRQCWVAKMRDVLAKVSNDVLLLRLTDHSKDVPDVDLRSNPLFITDDMMSALEPSVAGVIECEVARFADRSPTNPAGRGWGGPEFHRNVAMKLKEPVSKLTGSKKAAPSKWTRPDCASAISALTISRLAPARL